MPARRLPMRTAREILRLRFDLGQRVREIARAAGVPRSTVSDTLARAKRAGLACWPLPADIDEDALQARLYPAPAPSSAPARPLPDWDYIFAELRRKGVTLELLWHEYRGQHPDHGYSYSRYCELYRDWRGGLEISMHQEHLAGDKVFVDFAGHTLALIDAETGEITEQQIFVAALGASDYIYAEALPGQDTRSWIKAHVNLFEHIGGVTAAVVPDNLKAAVIKPCRYEPQINASYQEMAEHYGTAVLPARVRKPKDKAKAEQAVLMVERWVLAPLRNQRFFSLAQMNQAIRERLIELNARKLTKLGVSRRELFESIDRPALRPLPTTRYQYADWKRDVGVGIDYHVEFERHRYSVPYKLRKQRVDVKSTLAVIEIFYKGSRIVTHRRSSRPGGFTTDRDHMPSSHRRYAEWTPERIVGWAKSIGPQTAALIKDVLACRPHPEHGFRSCLGIISLGKKYGNERLEAACHRARHIRTYSYKSVKSILRTGLDQTPLPIPTPESQTTGHGNLRGPDYYQ